MRCLAFIAIVLAARMAVAQVHETGFAIGDKFIPLPPGRWVQVTEVYREDHERRESIPIVTHRAALVQEAEDRAVAMIVVAVQTEVGVYAPPRGICGGAVSYGSVPATAYLERETLGIRRGSLDCRAIGTTTPAESILPHLRPLYLHRPDRPRYLPDRWLTVTILESEHPHTIEVEYHFDPTFFAPQTNGRPGGWSRGALGPERREVLARLWGWSATARDAVIAVLPGRRRPEALPAFPRQ